MRIAIRPYARAVGVAKAALAMFGVLAAIGLVADVSGAADSASIPEVVRGIIIIAAVLGGLIAVRVMWSNLRSAVVRKAWLAISASGVRIDHEGIFKKPVVIPRDQIGVATFDDRPARRRGRAHPRFALPDGRDGAPGYLYSRTGGSPFPILGHVPDNPNLALAFRSPIALSKVRRFVKAFPSRQVVFPPLHARPSRGLVIRLKEVDAARRALEDWGIVRPMVAEDLSAPGATSLRRAHRLRMRDNAMLGVLILGQFALPLALAETEDLGPPDVETFAALGRICEADPPPAPAYRPPSENLGELLPTRVSDGGAGWAGPRDRGLRLFFDSPIDTADAALFARTDVPRWTSELLAADYRRGYARRWSAGGRVVFATVWEFSSPEDAQDFEAFARSDYCPFVQDAFLVPQLPDAVGMTLLYQETAFDQVTFLRGRYRFMLGLESKQPQADHDSILYLVEEVKRTAGG